MSAPEIVSAERAEVLREDRIGPVDADDLARSVIALHARVAELTRERDAAWRAGAEAMRGMCTGVAVASADHATRVVGGGARFVTAKEIEFALRDLPLPERTEGSR